MRQQSGRQTENNGNKMSSWRKRIKRKFGRYSGDVSPPAALVDDLPPPFARSLSLRHPGYTSRDGDLRPESFLLLDDQRIPTLRRTWSFRQAVAKSSSANQQPLQNGQGFFNGSSSGNTLLDCPGSPSLNKPPPFFSRLFRFSTRDKNRKAGSNLPPSVAHVDVIRKGDPESPQDEPDGVFSAENLSQWPSVQSDIVTSFVEPTNDAATTSFMSQWASVPMDMTSSHACHNNSEWSSSQDNCGATEPVVDDDEEDPDVVVIRRSSTLPSFRSRAGYSSSEQITTPNEITAHLSEQAVDGADNVDGCENVMGTKTERENRLSCEPSVEAPKTAVVSEIAGEFPCNVDPGAKKKRKRNSRNMAEPQLSDELKFVLLNGTFPPKHEDKPAPRLASATIPGHMIESPCSEDSAVFDLSPVNPLTKNAESRPSDRKYKIDSAIFDCKAAPANLPDSPVIGPVIDLEDPKATRRRFEAQLPSSCRPSSVSPVRDPAVVRRVKKMTTSIRPISYTAGIGPMQRASTDLHQIVLSRNRSAQKQEPSMLERSCSAEALAPEVQSKDEPTVNGDLAQTARQDASRTSRGSELSDEVDSGTFVRKKPNPLQRNGTFTKEDRKLRDAEVLMENDREVPAGIIIDRDIDDAAEVKASECGTETHSTAAAASSAAPGDSSSASATQSSPSQGGGTFSRPSGPCRGGLRKPSELKVCRITKESQEFSSSENVLPVISKELKSPGTEPQVTPGNGPEHYKLEARKNCKLHIPLPVAKSDSETCLVESVTRVAEEAQEKIRFVMRQTVSSNARRKKSIDVKESISEKPEGNKVSSGSEVVKKVATKTTQAAPKAPDDGVGEQSERQSSKVDFEVEIARLGKICEARSAELDNLRKELQNSTAAHGALAFAAHYWSERLRRTEEYSARLRSQLLLAGKVISNAHNDIENLENKLQQEVATHKDEMQKFEEAKQQKITELEAKQVSVLEELRSEHERKVDELKSSQASASQDTVHKSRLIELQEEHECALEALRQSKEAEFNALRETQRDLERRLDEKNHQCRRVEEEAAALKAKLLQSADARAQWLNEKINSLEKEVESLNAVLEMKVAENRELLAEKRENQDRKERMALMQEALDKQRAKIEDLKAQLDIKTETQQKLTSENVKLLELSEKKDRIISQMDRHFEELKYKMQDGTSFTVDVSTPVHRPLRETKSFGAPPDNADVDEAMSRSWHLSFREKSQKESNDSRSASSDSKDSDEDDSPHVLENVFTQDEGTALEETVSTPVVATAASRA
ncbi:uncharacterized protein LOC100899026 [Galendromus occidentalis]|uniref:Uncharacterized protein LOC100899026 n=1 Tax=Galendromus occidentalis TaxID=34638 RepID=A0AAJ7WKF1_9ACAR|nr:uncharacterized protein LOC100899026 [Galendromus occidentalis]